MTPASLRGRTAFLRRPVRAVEYAGDWLMGAPNSEGAFRSADLALARISAHGLGEARSEPVPVSVADDQPTP